MIDDGSINFYFIGMFFDGEVIIYGWFVVILDVIGEILDYIFLVLVVFFFLLDDVVY